MKVLYVGGGTKSGSTLLDLMLGQVPGFVSVGELRQIWQRGLVEDSRCGCRLAFHECPYWTAVGLAAFGGWDRLDLAAVLELRNSLDRVSTLRTLKRPGSRPQEEARIEAYVSILENLLRGIQEVSGAGVIVDSSKTPSHALLLARVPDVDLRLIHLVRDSRGVAYSWKRATRGKQRKRKLRSLRARLGVNLSASMRWASYNARIPTLTHVGIPYRFVRYEDMVGDPRTCLREILGWADEATDDEALSFVGAGRVMLHENHTVYGNRLRFSVGELPLRLDEEWRREMSTAGRLGVTVMTFPLLKRYGYRLGARPAEIAEPATATE